MPQVPYAQLLRYTHKTDSQVRRFPIVGPWLSHVGHVVNILATPGPQNPQLWVEGFFYALPRLVFLKTKPFLQAEEAYRFLNGRCGRRGKGKIAEFAKALGLKDLGGVPTPGLNGTVKMIFETTIDFGLKAEWYFMIIDRATEFAYNWTSLVYQWEDIKVEGEPHAIGNIPQGYHFEGEGNPLKGWAWTSEFIITGEFEEVDVPPGIGASVGYTVNSLPSAVSGNRVADISTQLVEILGGYTGPVMRAQAVSPTLSTASDVSFYNGETRTGPQAWAVILTNHSLDTVPSLNATMHALGSNVGKKGLFFDP